MLSPENISARPGTQTGHCGTLAGDQGPVERRLLGFPPLIKLVMGPNAECSEDMHELLELDGGEQDQIPVQNEGRSGV